MWIEEHGGGCCGISHFADFPVHPAKVHFEEFEKKMAGFNKETEFIDYNDQERKGKHGHCLEVALVDEQMVAWAPTLKAAGFKLVTRFLNDNSGNVVNVLLYTTKKTNRPRPFKW